MIRKRAEHVVSLARAHADQPDRPGRGLVQRCPDPLLYPGQAEGQPAGRVAVGSVPVVPVAFGHGVKLPGPGWPPCPGTISGPGRRRSADLRYSPQWKGDLAQVRTIWACQV